MRIVLKVGGAVLEDRALLDRCVRNIAGLVADGHKVVVVHGGGQALTRTLEQLGKTSEFVNGLRITDAETRDVALMVLAGSLNKRLVAALARVGQPAMGFCGGDGLAFRARKRANGKDEADLGFVGDICSVDARWLEAMWAQGAVPVISSLALGYDGEYYNVNADQMAAACAVACHANALIFLTDVSGVWDSQGGLISHLGVPQMMALVESAAVKGGMLPKLEACRRALSGGVGRVRILPASHVESLSDFYFTKVEFGTEVVAQ